MDILLVLMLMGSMVASIAATRSSLRGSLPRALTWGNNCNKKQRRMPRGCNGKKCIENKRAPKELQGVEVVSIENTMNETAVTETPRDRTKKVPQDNTGLDTPTISSIPSNTEPYNGNEEDCNKKRPNKPQQGSSPLKTILSTLPMCCECTKLPCNCQLDSIQHSLLFKMAHTSVQQKSNVSSASCQGENCKRQSETLGDDSTQGDPVVGEGEESASREEPREPPCTSNDCSSEVSNPEDANDEEDSAKLMCCCNHCSGIFPCTCSCDYFTLSQAPSFP